VAGGLVVGAVPGHFEAGRSVRSICTTFESWTTICTTPKRIVFTFSATTEIQAEAFSTSAEERLPGEGLVFILVK
jgi:hypothetical protein